MTRTHVESSNIESIGYDGAEVMEVRFRDGMVYTLTGPTPELHRDFMAAPSVGGFFHRYLQGRYPDSVSPYWDPIPGI